MWGPLRSRRANGLRQPKGPDVIILEGAEEAHILADETCVQRMKNVFFTGAVVSLPVLGGAALATLCQC